MSYFANHEKYRLKYPIVSLKSKDFNNFESNFILDPSLEINIIKESAIVPYLLTEPTYYSLKKGSLLTKGQVKLNCGKSNIEFHLVSYSSKFGIAGILGAPYLNSLFKTKFVTRTLIEAESSKPSISIQRSKFPKNQNLRSKIIQIIFKTLIPLTIAYVAINQVHKALL